MDFRTATDGLFEKIDQKELANQLGVSIASIRQARLRPEAAAHRAPPSGWELAVEKLIERRIARNVNLLERLRRERQAATKTKSGRALSRESQISSTR
jgi:hypothetical protein